VGYADQQKMVPSNSSDAHPLRFLCIFNWPRSDGFGVI